MGVFIFVLAFIMGVLLALGLIVSGASKKKAILVVAGVGTGILIFCFVIVLILVNSPWWTM
ncbi:MAG: hypothetical protein ACE5GO_02005 [Anaerolineales bacterium]